MKTFINSGLLTGFLALVVGFFILLDKFDLFQNGEETTATITGFDTVRERARHGYRTIYYPVVEYYFQNKRYQQKYDYRQVSNSSPLTVGDTITILCTSSRPSKPYFGNMTQLAMINLFLPITGLVILAFFGIMNFSSQQDNAITPMHEEQHMPFATNNQSHDIGNQNGNQW